MARAGDLDGKAASAFDDESADLTANIGALNRAIAALEKGVAESSFLQCRIGSVICEIADNAVKEMSDVTIPQIIEAVTVILK